MRHDRAAVARVGTSDRWRRRRQRQLHPDRTERRPAARCHIRAISRRRWSRDGWTRSRYSSTNTHYSVWSGRPGRRFRRHPPQGTPPQMCAHRGARALALSCLASRVQERCARFTCRETSALAWNIRVTGYLALLAGSKMADLVTNLNSNFLLYRSTQKHESHPSGGW